MDLEDRPFFYDDALGSYDWTDIWKPEIEKSISNLQYDDTHFFTIDDYQLFLPMYDTMNKSSQDVLDEVTKPDRMLKGHAESMLKAVEFWKLRYDTTYQVWLDRFSRVMGCVVDKRYLNDWVWNKLDFFLKSLEIQYPHGRPLFYSLKNHFCDIYNSINL